jgi:hypothetical protein
MEMKHLSFLLPENPWAQTIAAVTAKLLALPGRPVFPCPSHRMAMQVSKRSQSKWKDLAPETIRFEHGQSMRIPEITLI